MLATPSGDNRSTQLADVLSRTSSELRSLTATKTAGWLYSQPFCRAMRAASVRFDAPNLLIASER